MHKELKEQVIKGDILGACKILNGMGVSDRFISNGSEVSYSSLNRGKHRGYLPHEESEKILNFIEGMYL